MKNSTKKLSWVLGRFEIRPKPAQIERQTGKFGLDWDIEVLHIYAWLLHKGGWDQFNWAQKLDQWGKRTKRTDPLYSKIPTFGRARKEIEALGLKALPDFVEDDDSTLEFEPESIEDILSSYGENDIYLYMVACRDMTKGREDLADRYSKLIKWLGWLTGQGIGGQADSTHTKIVQACSRGWLDHGDLRLYIASQNHQLDNFIKYIMEPYEQQEETAQQEEATQQDSPEATKPEETEEVCIIDGQEYEALYFVACKVEGCRLPLLGRVIAEDGDQILVWLVAPVNGEDRFWLKKSLCKIIKDDLQTQRGNISKEQIDESISKMAGE